MVLFIFQTSHLVLSGSQLSIGTCFGEMRTHVSSPAMASLNFLLMIVFMVKIGLSVTKTSRDPCYLFSAVIDYAISCVPPILLKFVLHMIIPMIS